MMQVSPHLCFDGSCRAAFTAYQNLFGGTIVTLLTYGESPMAAQYAPELHPQIFHATLKVGDMELTGVDLPRDVYRKPQGFFVTLTVDDALEAERIFTSLAEGGEIHLKFQSTFWSQGFGVVIDRFGIPWELNSAQPKHSS